MAPRHILSTFLWPSAPLSLSQQGVENDLQSLPGLENCRVQLLHITSQSFPWWSNPISQSVKERSADKIHRSRVQHLTHQRHQSATLDQHKERADTHTHTHSFTASETYRCALHNTQSIPYNSNREISIVKRLPPAVSTNSPMDQREIKHTLSDQGSRNRLWFEQKTQENLK